MGREMDGGAPVRGICRQRNGKRIAYVVTASSDRGVVTNGITTYDLLGRVESMSVPYTDGSAVTTTYTYDGTSSRILTSTYAASDVERKAKR